MLFFITLFAISYAQPQPEFQGEIVCNLCVDTIEHVKDLVETKGIDFAREYLDGLCDKAPGLLSSLCTDLVSFGMDEILKMIENRVHPREICETIEICPLPQELKGEIVCDLCTGTIDRLKDIIETSGAEKVKSYLETLCDKASGFINTICDKLVEFGIDKLIQLLENKVDSMEICQKVKLC